MNETNRNEKKDPCLKFACKLQYCLQNSGYVEEKCSSIVNELIKCCQENYSSFHNDNLNVKEVSATCSGFIK